MYKTNITLKEFLLHETKVRDFVFIEDSGWYIGCTIIDDEDLFIESLNPKMLENIVETVKHTQVTVSGVKIDTIVVNI